MPFVARGMGAPRFHRPLGAVLVSGGAETVGDRFRGESGPPEGVCLSRLGPNTAARQSEVRRATGRASEACGARPPRLRLFRRPRGGAAAGFSASVACPVPGGPSPATLLCVCVAASPSPSVFRGTRARGEQMCESTHRGVASLGFGRIPPAWGEELDLAMSLLRLPAHGIARCSFFCVSFVGACLLEMLFVRVLSWPRVAVCLCKGRGSSSSEKHSAQSLT